MCWCCEFVILLFCFATLIYQEYESITLMRVRLSSENIVQKDPEWVQEFASFLERNGNKKKFQSAKKIFVETYFENIRSGCIQRKRCRTRSLLRCVFLLFQSLMVCYCLLGNFVLDVCCGKKWGG